MIVFTRHAREKFKILRSHRLVVSEMQAIKTLEDPDFVDRESRASLFVAQRMLDKTHVLRVVYSKRNGDFRVITFYPGRRKQYEKNR